MSPRTWHIDPLTLRGVPDDRPALGLQLGGASAADRVWLLSLLGRSEEAVAEGERLLGTATDRWRLLLGKRLFDQDERAAALGHIEAACTCGPTTAPTPT